MKVIGNNWKQTIFFTTNVGEQFEVKEHNLITIELDKPECVPFVHIRNGLKAGICRSVYYRLADLIVSKKRKSVSGVRDRFKLYVSHDFSVIYGP